MMRNSNSVGKRKLLVVQRSQFGYLTDTYKIADQLQTSLDIHFVCLDGGYPRLPSTNVSVQYVSATGPRVVRVFRLIFAATKAIRSMPTATVFVVYFPLCSCVKLLADYKCNMDIRTGAVSKSWLLRVVSDTLLKLEANVFDRVSVISDGLRERLGVSKKRSWLLPLGADVISGVSKTFDYPRLFYIGTLNNRCIDDTIKGLANFLETNPDFKGRVSYDIVGFGQGKEVARLKEMIAKCKLEEVVKFHGRLGHNDARKFFDNCNIGVSYVPMTPYYDYQPPTKTFEYVLSGMPVLATATIEHRQIIGEANGVLCKDDAASFSHALEALVARFPFYDDRTVRSTLKEHSWDKIAGIFRESIIDG